MGIKSGMAVGCRVRVAGLGGSEATFLRIWPIPIVSVHVTSVTFSSIRLLRRRGSVSLSSMAGESH